MNRQVILGTAGLAAIVLFACSPAPAIPTDSTATPLRPTATLRVDTATPVIPIITRTDIPQITPTTAPTTGSEYQADISFPLSEPGPYNIGNRKYAFNDENRDGREVRITVWYPALEHLDSKGMHSWRDAAPDMSGAPYPLILSSSETAGTLAAYLVTHGFTWCSVDGLHSYPKMAEQMFEHPLDILFALRLAASESYADLDNVIDAGRAGAIGYSFDGYNALALSGARIDPEHYKAQCTLAETATRPIYSGMTSFNCDPAGRWQEFSALAGESITASEDGLWQPMTDERIRAVMPMAAEGWWLFGDQGLAAVNRPILIIAGSKDGLYLENAEIFDHLGTSNKALISFVDQMHMMIFDQEMAARIAHFAAAFFGFHLQGREDLAWYFSEGFVDQHNDLAWGR